VEVYVPAAEAAVPEADRGEIIATRRLTLRRFRPSDAAAFHAVLSDAEAMRYWSTPPHRHMAETEAWVERTIAAVAAGEADDFIALHEGSAVGKAGLWQGNELGMIFARTWWGRGYAGEAVQAIIGRAFARGLTAVRADVDPRNDRSIRLLRRLGFVQTGSAKQTLKIGDVWVDSVYFELQRGQGDL